jgi:hypothetical protein
MVSSAPVGIAKDAIIHAEQLARLDGQAGFLERLARCRSAKSFSHLEHTAWNRPFSSQWGMAALYQDYAVLLDDDCADTY